MSECPHVATSAEGTSYCTLAEFTAQRLDRYEEALREIASETRPSWSKDTARAALQDQPEART